MMKSVAMTLFLLCLASAAFGQTLAERGTPLDHFVGRWVMTGTIAGEEIVHDVEASWVLGGHYLFFHDLSRKREADGSPAYEARVYIGWDEAGQRLVCMWLDITGGGGLVPEGFGYGTPEGDRIPFVWGEGEDSGIHNTFTYQPEQDHWTWQIDNIRDGQPSNFARVTLTRISDLATQKEMSTAEEAGILNAIERLSEATETGGAGPDAYAAVLSNDFRRWTLSQDNVQDREAIIEGISHWWDEGWRVVQRESRMLDATIVDNFGYTQRIVTESYRDPSGTVSEPATFALEETWQQIDGRWLLSKVTVYPAVE